MYDVNFNKLIDFIFGTEKGYVNDKDDSGGPTNLGVTHTIYDAWNREHGKPLKDIKQITRKEAKEIYYHWYWLESGANKLEDLREAYVLFDMAINSNPYEAKRIFKESNNDIYKFLKNRKEYYKKVIKAHPEKKKFKEGWDNRLKEVEDNVNKIVEKGLYTPPYENEITPFDKEYDGSVKIGVKKDGSKYTSEELAKARNRYLYMQYKKGEYDNKKLNKTPSTNPIKQNTKQMSHEINNDYNHKSNNDWSDKDIAAMLEGFDSGELGEGNKSYRNEDDWKKQFNVGDPNTDKGHWITMNGTHIFIKDKV